MTLWLAVALIALAPLACIAYCRITHEVAHRAMHHATAQDAGDAPLNDMQQMVQAVTDALPMQAAWLALLIILAFRISLQFVLRQEMHLPPKPPPRQVVLPPLFADRIVGRRRCTRSLRRA